MFGLPHSVGACPFTFDGVPTQTARVHRGAWRRAADAFSHAGHPLAAEFSPAKYNEYVDGKPREDGVRDLLGSRGITLAAAVVTALADGEDVVAVGGFATLVGTRVDGIVAVRNGLRGKPTLNTCPADARMLGVQPAQADLLGGPR